MTHLGYFLLGAALGLIFLAMLWGSVRLLLSHSRGRRLYPLLALGRFLFLGLAFYLLARQGPLAAPLALAGLLAARTVVLGRVRRQVAEG